MYNNTTLDDYYEDAEMSFADVFAIVKGKMANKLPMTTAKEEAMKAIIEAWTETFGYDSL